MLRDELLAASAELEQRLRKPARAAPRRGLVLQRTRSSPSLGTTLHPEIGLAGSLAGAGLFRRHYLDRKNLRAGRALSMEQLPSSWSPGIAARAASATPFSSAAVSTAAAAATAAASSATASAAQPPAQMRGKSKRGFVVNGTPDNRQGTLVSRGRIARLGGKHINPPTAPDSGPPPKGGSPAPVAPAQRAPPERADRGAGLQGLIEAARAGTGCLHAMVASAATGGIQPSRPPATTPSASPMYELLEAQRDALALDNACLREHNAVLRASLNHARAESAMAAGQGLVTR